MNAYLEDLIRDAQQRQAGRAVPPERILAGLAPLGGAQPRPRVRPRRVPLLAAACALVLAVAAAPVASRMWAPPPVADAATWSGTVPDFGQLRSPLEIWPDAVRRIPGTLPDGGYFTVSAVLGRDRYVVKAGRGVAATGDLPTWPLVFDSVARTARPLGQPALWPYGSDLADVFVAGDQALWGLQKRNEPYELWGAALDGGSPARLITRWPLDGVAYPIGVQDGVTYWRYAGEKGVTGIYRMPLATLVPALVPGSPGYQDFGAFPWVSSARPEGTGGALAARGPRSGDLLNVVTGERRTWTAHGDTAAVDCNPVLCVGLDAAGRVTAQRLDGSGFRRIPYSQQALPYEQTALAGRFGIGSFTESGGQTWIWDRATGAAASVPRAHRYASVRMPKTVVQWEEPDGAEYVLDLAAVR